MNDLLRPMPMTPAQIVSLVERTRRNMRETVRHEPRSAPVTVAGAEYGRRPLSELAALVAHNCSVRISDAAEQMGITSTAVYRHWRRLFPGCRPAGKKQTEWHAATCPKCGVP